MQYGSASYRLNVRDFRHNTRHDTSIMSFIEKFYPDKTLRILDVEKSQRAYSMANRLKKQNCLEKTDATYPPTYRLTMQGRCRFLCLELDINFLSLCMMTEGYVIHKHQNASGTRWIYPIRDTMDTFDGVYAEKTVRNTASILCRKGLAYSVSRNIIQISKLAMLKLAKHEMTVYELHKWLLELPGRLNRMAVEEYHANKISSDAFLTDG